MNTTSEICFLSSHIVVPCKQSPLPAASEGIFYDEQVTKYINKTFTTPWTRVLQKSIVAQQPKQFPKIYGTRLFFTLLTTD